MQFRFHYAHLRHGCFPTSADNLNLRCFTGHHREAERFAQEVFSPAAQEGFRSRVGETHHAIPVHDDDGIGILFNDHAEAHFAGQRPLPLDGIADGPHQQVAVHLALDQIVLCPFLNRLNAKCFIGKTGQHHDGRFWGLSASFSERFQPLAVRQPEIQQDYVNASFSQAFQPGREPVGPLQVEPAGRQGTTLHLGQRFPDDQGVVLVVLDEQDTHGLHLTCERECAPRGSSRARTAAVPGRVPRTARVS